MNFIGYIYTIICWTFLAYGLFWYPIGQWELTNPKIIYLNDARNLFTV